MLKKMLVVVLSALLSASVYAQSLEELKSKAEAGDAKAQVNLGNAYYEGQGVRQDDSEAVQWYRKAAEQGLAGAQYNLGVMYGRGYGVRQNYATAKEWYGKACDGGYQYGCDRYKDLKQKGY